MFDSRLGLGCVISVLPLLFLEGTALAQEATSSGAPPARQENQLHIELEGGYQFFDPAALYEGLLPYGRNVQGGGLNGGLGVDYNFNQFSVGARLQMGRVHPNNKTSEIDPYGHFNFGPEIGWLRHFEHISVHLQLAYAYHRMKHYHYRGEEYGGGTLITAGHGFRPSAALRWRLGSHLYIGARANLDVIFFHRNNEGTFLCAADLNCDPENSIGLSTGGAGLVGFSF